MTGKNEQAKILQNRGKKTTSREFNIWIENKANSR